MIKNCKTLSKQMLDRIEKIPTIRFLRYRDISPVLKEAVAIIASEFADLNKGLKQPEMLERPYLLSRAGGERWEKTIKVVDETLYVRPEPN